MDNILIISMCGIFLNLKLHNSVTHNEVIFKTSSSLQNCIYEMRCFLLFRFSSRVLRTLKIIKWISVSEGNR